MGVCATKDHSNDCLSNYKQCTACKHRSCQLSVGDKTMHCMYLSDEGRSLLGQYGGNRNALWQARENGTCIGYEEDPKKIKKRRGKTVVRSKEYG